MGGALTEENPLEVGRRSRQRGQATDHDHPTIDLRAELADRANLPPELGGRRDRDRRFVAVGRSR
jgi:hypothetical protein